MKQNATYKTKITNVMVKIVERKFKVLAEIKNLGKFSKSREKFKIRENQNFAMLKYLKFSRFREKMSLENLKSWKKFKSRKMFTIDETGMSRLSSIYLEKC